MIQINLKNRKRPKDLENKLMAVGWGEAWGKGATREFETDTHTHTDTSEMDQQGPTV